MREGFLSSGDSFGLKHWPFIRTIFEAKDFCLVSGIEWICIGY